MQNQAIGAQSVPTMETLLDGISTSRSRLYGAFWQIQSKLEVMGFSLPTPPSSEPASPELQPNTMLDATEREAVRLNELADKIEWVGQMLDKQYRPQLNMPPTASNR